MNDHPMLIAGGGIGGLAAALGLARQGMPVRLFEQAPAFEEVGAGLQMSPNGVRALRALGAWEAVEPACVIPSEIHMRDGRSGALLQRIRLGKTFEERTNGRYKLVMNEAIAMPGAYIVPRGNPAGRDNVMKFIQQALQVDSQLMILDCLGMTPSNPEAFAKIPEAMQPYAINSAQNIDKVIFNDPVWWADNGGDAVNAFLEAIG